MVEKVNQILSLLNVALLVLLFADKETCARDATALITNPVNIVEQFLQNEVAKQPNKNYQFWANQTLAHLSVMYPMHRFLIIIYDDSNPGPISANNELVDYFFYKKGQRKFWVLIYVTVALNRFAGYHDCYGDLKNMFKDCAADTVKIANYMDSDCKIPDKFSPKTGARSVLAAIRLVKRDDYSSMGLAWNVPDNAVNVTEYGCQGAEAANKKWRVITALYQEIDEPIVDFFKTLPKEHRGTAQEIKVQPAKEKCEPGWSKFERHCYIAISEGGGNWVDALTTCAEKGAQLASVHSEAENKFIGDLIKTGPDNTFYWLGMRIKRNQTTGQITRAVWQDGTPVGFGDPTSRQGQMPWLNGKPEKVVKKDNCAQLFGTSKLPKFPAETWNDYQCWFSHDHWTTNPGMICKKAATVWKEETKTD